MVATCGDVSATEGCVTAGVLLSCSVVGIAVPVDWQRMVVKRVVVDTASIVLQTDIVDPSSSGAASATTDIGTTIDQQQALGDIARGTVGGVVNNRRVAEFSHHFGEHRCVAGPISNRRHLDPLGGLIQCNAAKVTIEDPA